LRNDTRVIRLGLLSMSEANEDAGERTNGDARSRHTNRICLPSTADEDEWQSHKKGLRLYLLHKPVFSGVGFPRRADALLGMTIINMLITEQSVQIIYDCKL